MERQYREMTLHFSPDEWDAAVAFGHASCPLNEFTESQFAMAAFLETKSRVIEVGKKLVLMDKMRAAAEMAVIEADRRAEEEAQRKPSDLPY
jgi:hypothetical protein